MPSDVLFSEFLSNDTTCTMTMTVSNKNDAAKVIDTLRSFDSLSSVMVSSLTEKQIEADEEGAEPEEELEEGELQVYETAIEYQIICQYKPVELDVTIPEVNGSN